MNIWKDELLLAACVIKTDHIENRLLCSSLFAFHLCYLSPKYMWENYTAAFKIILIFLTDAQLRKLWDNEI